MRSKDNTDVITEFLAERRETEMKEKTLREEIARLQTKRDEIAMEDPSRKEEELKGLDLRINALKQELESQICRRRNICKAARTFTSGD